MICQPAAARKGKRRNGPGRPRIHPTRGTLACRSAGADGATANPRAPAAAAAHCHRSGRVPAGRDRGGGLQMAMSVRPCPGCSAVPAGAADAACASRTGPRWSSASGCAWTAPVSAPPPWGGEPPDGVRRGRHQGAAGGLREYLQELRRGVRAAPPATRIRPLGTCPASSKPTRRGEADDAGCVTTRLRRWVLPGHFGADPLRRVDQDILRVAAPWRHS